MATRINIDTMRDQLQLVEALQKIAEDDATQIKVSCHSMPDRASFISEPVLLPMSDFETSLDESSSNMAHCLSNDEDDQADTPLSYEPICTIVDETPLQVDQNGAKVNEHSLSSPWIPKSVLLDISHTSKSLSPPGIESSPRAVSYATVSAAAMTAAMIIEPESSVPKRPRSSPPAFSEEARRNDDDFFSKELDDSFASDATLDDPDVVDDIHGAQRENLCYSGDDGDTFDDPSSPITPVMSPAVQDGPKMTELAATSPSNGVSSVHPELSSSEPSAVATESNILATSQLQPYTEASRNAALFKKRRAEAMERFRRKKAVRCYGRRVRYQIRKRIATTRPRVNGRFARRADVESHSSATSTNKE